VPSACRENGIEKRQVLSCCRAKHARYARRSSSSRRLSCSSSLALTR